MGVDAGSRSQVQELSIEGLNREVKPGVRALMGETPQFGLRYLYRNFRKIAEKLSGFFEKPMFASILRIFPRLKKILTVD
jgi:hypothetical protein